MHIQQDVYSVHPNRDEIFQELLDRPFPCFPTPGEVIHLTFLHHPESEQYELDHVQTLIDYFPEGEVTKGSRFMMISCKEFEFRWQRHVEFSSYCISMHKPKAAPFENQPMDFLPKSWLKGCHGTLIGGVRMAIEQDQGEGQLQKRLNTYFQPHLTTGVAVRQNQAVIWTDFQLKKDGLVHILLQNKSLAPMQTGRLGQRMLDLEMYRVLSLLAKPLVKEVSSILAKDEYAMLLIADHINKISSIEDQKSLLKKISQLAAQVEELRSHEYRFSASNAYFELTQERLKELMEVKMKGVMTLTDFINRRLVPALRTCQSTQKRIDALGDRIAHARELVLASINLSIEDQNQALLASMEKRSELQLQLQEAVEGFSIVAISYYLVGLLKYLASGIKLLGIPLNSDLATAVAVPIVLFGVWFGVGRLKSHVLK